MTAKCYKALDNGNIINECWYSAYDTLLEIIEEEQKKYPGGFGELAEIDERTEYKYNVQGWVDDYFKELNALGGLRPDLQRWLAAARSISVGKAVLCPDSDARCQRDGEDWHA